MKKPTNRRYENIELDADELAASDKALDSFGPGYWTGWRDANAGIRRDPKQAVQYPKGWDAANAVKLARKESQL